jgi:hypothetical protein
VLHESLDFPMRVLCMILSSGAETLSLASLENASVDRVMGPNPRDFYVEGE